MFILLSTATFIVHVQDGETIKLQSEKHSNHWLAIKNDSIVGTVCLLNHIDMGSCELSLRLLGDHIVNSRPLIMVCMCVCVCI